ncbi:copper resistance protein B [Acetobacteraceae bacterium KSS8]|uniref:Copper resistance protein B n=1 Tax=Endosaccharibacter trunci TaxID=2812733 RepID=A0ABT1WA81_9PROT|nr:copper resistance protein B [Acetobacteraceae bacterium KSS8]
MNARTTMLASAIMAAVSGAASAQSPSTMVYPGGMPPVMDNNIYAHAILEQFEDRVGDGQQFRYDGQGWIGTDLDKLWFKSEGTTGRFGDGDHEILLDRAVSTYFDLQGGVRIDLDDGPTRTWAALGVQGLSLYFFDIEATGYIGDRGRTAARFQGSYDLLLTNRLILQPQVEINFYGQADRARQNGSGLSDIDSGLRLRYEWSRKFAPYIGVTYAGSVGQARSLARERGESAGAAHFTFGLRSWF